MYYEDHYHPNAEDEEQYMPDEDYHVKSETASVISSVDTLKQKQRKSGDKTKNIDKDYRLIDLIVKNKNVKIDAYCTQMNPGSMIRNAISGFRNKECLVGSVDEDQFFKVRYSACKEPYTLFYDTPDQYERHQKATLSTQLKEAWVNKSINAEQ